MKNTLGMYEDKIIQLIKTLFERNYEVCLMSFCKAQKDEEAIEDILNKCDEKIKSKIQKYYYDGNMQEALNIIADSQIVVGSRFHANILGLIFGKKIIPVLYSDKTKHVLEDLQIPVKSIDIRNLDEANIDEILNHNLNINYDVEKQRENSKMHFTKLDEVLEVNKK